jgi:hypothetical protein
MNNLPIQDQSKSIRDAIEDAITLVVSEVCKHIKPCQLFWMPEDESLRSLGDIIKPFYYHEGDTFLVPLEHFKEAGCVSLPLSVGAIIIDGFSFPYPRSVVLSPIQRRIVYPEKSNSVWCAYPQHTIGYAKELHTAAAICAASVLEKDA